MKNFYPLSLIVLFISCSGNQMKGQQEQAKEANSINLAPLITNKCWVPIDQNLSQRVQSLYFDSRTNRVYDECLKGSNVLEPENFEGNFKIQDSTIHFDYPISGKFQGKVLYVDEDSLSILQNETIINATIADDSDYLLGTWLDVNNYSKFDIIENADQKLLGKFGTKELPILIKNETIQFGSKTPSEYFISNNKQYLTLQREMEGASFVRESFIKSLAYKLEGEWKTKSKDARILFQSDERDYLFIKYANDPITHCQVTDTTIITDFYSFKYGLKEGDNGQELHLVLENGQKALYTKKEGTSSKQPEIELTDELYTKKYCFIKNIDDQDGTYILGLDFIQWIEGADTPSGIDIKNENPKIRHFKIDEGTKLKAYIKGGIVEDLEFSAEKLVRNISQYKKRVWIVDTKDGQITFLRQQYLP